MGEQFAAHGLHEVRRRLVGTQLRAHVGTHVGAHGGKVARQQGGEGFFVARGGALGEDEGVVGHGSSAEA